MPEIITASQLRAVLGVSISLYSDAALEDIIETAEAAIGDFLTQHKVAIVEHALTDDVAYIYTDRAHKFYIGQTVTIEDQHGHGWNGNQVITTIPNDFTFTFAYVGADEVRHAIIPHGTAAATDLSYYADFPAVEEAILQVSIDVFNSRLAAGGTQQALDYTPAPYRMGRTLLYKVTGLLSKYLDTDSFVG